MPLPLLKVTFYVIVVALIASSGGLLFGYDLVSKIDWMLHLAVPGAGCLAVKLAPHACVLHLGCI